MRFNPFTPGKRLTRPDLFSGRTSQLETGINLLGRAAGGNVRHGLITGDRGIGKSSLASQIQGIARGDEKYRRLGNGLVEREPFNFLVAEHIAQGGEKVGDVAAGLLAALDRSRKKSAPTLKWEFQIDLKIFKATATGREPVARDVVTAFVDELESTWKSAPEAFDGILLVIDEVDRVAEEPGIPTFFKVATENMTGRGLENIMLLPVGMLGVQDLLKAEHASVARVFDVIHVPLLTQQESMGILERALDDTDVQIELDVSREIARLSGGFPHPVHLLGSECFDLDDDGLIDQQDLGAAVHSIVTEKWKEEFDTNFVAAGSGKNRDIVKAMAKYPGVDVPVAYICDVLDVEQPQISSNFNTLMKRNVIVRPDRGVYRFRDPLFRQYVSTLNVLGGEPVEVRPRKRKAARTRRAPGSDSDSKQ